MTSMFFSLAAIAPSHRSALRAGWVGNVGIVILGFWLFSAEPLAGQVIQDAFATRGFRGADVLRVETRLESPPTRSIGVVRVTVINPKRPSPADRRLRAVLYIRSENSSGQSVAHSKSFVLGEGQRRATVELPYVESLGNTAWDIGLFEDGRDLEDKRQRPTNQLSFNINNAVNTPLANSLAVLLGQSESAQAVSQELSGFVELRASALRNNAPASNLLFPGSPVQKFVPIGEAAEDWRMFYPYWLWILSIDAIRECSQERPAVARAVRSYIATGGSILVHGVKEDDLSEVQQFLDYGEISNDRWRRVDASTSWRLPDEVGVSFANSVEHGFKQQLASGGCLGIGYVAGSVFVVGNRLADMEASALEQITLNNGGRKLAGQAVEADGNWFWLNLIQAAGKPPVWTFAILVSLFGAVLGPGLLFLTARLGRRSLMIFLVPLASLMATLAVVGYGVVYEGFGTHVRVTSLMQVDAGSQTGFAWSRQNFFSGLPPAGGLTLRGDTYARPVFGENKSRHIYADPRENIGYRIQLDEGQRWLGWLKPRQQQQLLVGHPVDEPQMPVRVSKSDEGVVSVVNQSGGSLPLFIFRGAGDDYYYTEALADGEGVDLKPLSKDEAKSLVQRGMVDLLPRPPADMNAGGSLFNFRNRGSSNTSRSRASDFIKLAIDDYLSEKLRMKPFSFATILAENDQIEVPVEGQHAGDLHIVVGDLPW